MNKNIRALTTSAMLTAMSVIIGIICKNFLNFGGGLFRITFENLPIILTGILYGPIVGGAVGIATDLISYFLSSQMYPPNLIVTVGAHIVGSMIIKPIGLFQFYQWSVLFRIPLYLVIAPIEILILCLLYRSSAFRRVIDKA